MSASPSAIVRPLHKKGATPARVTSSTFVHTATAAAFLSERTEVHNLPGGVEPFMYSDTLPVLTAAGIDKGKPLTKRWRIAHAGAPAAENYSKAVWFSVAKVTVYDLFTLEEELTRLQDAPCCCVIRGEPLPGTNISCTRRWSNTQEDGSPPTFKEKPRRWVLLDVDVVDDFDFIPIAGWRGATLIRSLLPRQFHNASCWWSFSGSAGVKPGLRMRLAFWLERPLGGNELGRWFASSPVDHAVFRTVQAIYVAAPIFDPPRQDPIPERCGLLPGDVDTVEVPEFSEPPKLDPAEAKRQVQEFRVRYGDDWPIASVTEVANKIQTTMPASMNAWGGSGRHHALFCGALRISGLIDKGLLPEAECRRILASAARNAGVSEAEIARTIRNAFRQGGL